MLRESIRWGSWVWEPLLPAPSAAEDLEWGSWRRQDFRDAECRVGRRDSLRANHSWARIVVALDNITMAVEEAEAKQVRKSGK